MTEQELFTTAVTGLLAQQAYSFDPDARDGQGSCLYRGPNGTKCAIGHLIPDHLYDESFEDRMAYSLSVALAAGIPYELTNFAGELQALHDDAARDRDPWPTFVTKLQGFAETHGLEMPA